MADDAYSRLIREIEDLMREARRLGMWRTTEGLHAALNTARSEVWEILPSDSPATGPTVTFTIGPVTDQKGS